ncbi:MAG: hypothetical protein O7D34_02360, partial [Ignavibacteria bacterium]|nr:hypothetical protein [Ignavibacteria bacterium]
LPPFSGVFAKTSNNNKKLGGVMKQQALNKLGAGFVVIALLGVVSIGCKDDSPTEPTSGQMSLSSRYSTNPISTMSLGSIGVTSPAAVDSITISRARFVLSRIKFKTSTDSTNFKTEPLIIELNLNGSVQDVSVAGVPFGAYREIEFKVHRVDSSDLVGFSSDKLALFADFLAGERYSIIIEGTVYRTGETGQAFAFQSRIDEKQKYDFIQELVVSEGSPALNVTVSVSSFGWFSDEGGALLDPTDSANENLIDDNVKSSIEVYKDNNRDGEKD